MIIQETFLIIINVVNIKQIKHKIKETSPHRQMHAHAQTK